MDEPFFKGFLKTFTGFNQGEFDRIFRKINEGNETFEKERLNRKKIGEEPSELEGSLNYS